MAFIVGAGLSLCGVLMQALTKNPLADPYVLGISSGASAGAVGVIILGWFSFLAATHVIFGCHLRCRYLHLSVTGNCIYKGTYYFHPTGSGRNRHLCIFLGGNQPDHLRIQSGF